MFIWSFIAHDLLPLGEIGVHEFENETAMLDALKTNVGDTPGFYNFPGHHAGPNATRQEKSEAIKRAMGKAVTGSGPLRWKYGLPLHVPMRGSCSIRCMICSK